MESDCHMLPSRVKYMEYFRHNKCWVKADIQFSFTSTEMERGHASRYMTIWASMDQLQAWHSLDFWEEEQSEKP